MPDLAGPSFQGSPMDLRVARLELYEIWGGHLCKRVNNFCYKTLNNICIFKTFTDAFYLFIFIKNTIN